VLLEVADEPADLQESVGCGQARAMVAASALLLSLTASCF
jgi:hypothetical protein